jgi:AmmeMemoRadiSam system protein B
MASLPRLRPIDARPFLHDGQPAILLRDPLQLSDHYAILPRIAAPLLALCDGTLDAQGISAAAAINYGLKVSTRTVEKVVDALDQALLLDNENFAAAHAAALQTFRQAPHRPAALAGASYPEDPEELRRYLQEFVDGLDEPGREAGPADSRGLVSPHIDYPRGGPVYARVWQRAARAAREADLAILLGTDHYGGRGLNLTHQSYATPFGKLPTPSSIVDALAEAVGGDQAFEGELRHKGEHSVELAAVWLHHMRGGEPIEMLPILCGSFSDYMRDGARPAGDAALEGAIEALREAMAGRRALVVAAGDLAHVGPAFGGEPLDGEGREALRSADEELMALMSAGDADGFIEALRRVGDSNNVCGISPIYLALRLLAPARGEPVAYDHCPADGEGTSVVSVCGVVFH